MAIGEMRKTSPLRVENHLLCDRALKTLSRNYGDSAYCRRNIVVFIVRRTLNDGFDSYLRDVLVEVRKDVALRLHKFPDKKVRNATAANTPK